MHNERQPLYIRIQEHFKRLIVSGALGPDEKIPSEKELMETFDVSRITVANALTQLAKEGWIYRIPGRGSFVSKSFPPQESDDSAAERGAVRALDASAGRGADEPPVRRADVASARPSDAKPVSEREGGAHGSPASEDERGDRARVPADKAPGRRMIGLIIPTVADFFALRLIQGINKMVQESDYYLSIVLTNHSKELEKEAIVQLEQKGVAGLIIFPIDAETYNEEILSLKVRNFPFVLIDRYLPGVDTHFVRSDSRLGAQLAVSHLWELGHRDIAICTDSPLQTVTVEERIAGYMEALKQRGAMINPAHMLTEFAVDYKDKRNNHALHRYMKSRLATAYITLNARLGMYIAGAARSLGMSVPGDLSIVTFDDPASEPDDPNAFTHVAQSEEEMGSRAAEILLELLDRPDRVEGYRKVVLEPKLVVRSSTGAPPKSAKAEGSR